MKKIHRIRFETIIGNIKKGLFFDFTNKGMPGTSSKVKMTARSLRAFSRLSLDFPSGTMKTVIILAKIYQQEREMTQLIITAQRKLPFLELKKIQHCVRTKFGTSAGKITVKSFLKILDELDKAEKE